MVKNAWWCLDFWRSQLAMHLNAPRNYPRHMGLQNGPGETCAQDVFTVWEHFCYCPTKESENTRTVQTVKVMEKRDQHFYGGTRKIQLRIHYNSLQGLCIFSVAQFGHIPISWRFFIFLSCHLKCLHFIKPIQCLTCFAKLAIWDFSLWYSAIDSAWYSLKASPTPKSLRHIVPSLK